MKNLIENWPLVVAVIVGVYDVIARLIPTVENYSVLHKVIEFLKWISDGLNVEKKKK